MTVHESKGLNSINFSRKKLKKSKPLIKKSKPLNLRKNKIKTIKQAINKPKNI